MEKTKVIGSKADISAMILSAERYALGRKTYIVDWTCAFIEKNLDNILMNDKFVMIKDIKDQKDYGHDCDKDSWQRLLAILEHNVEQQ